MNQSKLRVLQAASHVLNEKHPSGSEIEVLENYAKAELPDSSYLPLDELATVVALKLMDAYEDPAPDQASGQAGS